MRGKRHVWLAVYCANPITACGTLINLKFRVVDAPGSSSSLSLSGLVLNEANPTADGKSSDCCRETLVRQQSNDRKSKFDCHGPR